MKSLLSLAFVLLFAAGLFAAEPAKVNLDIIKTKLVGDWVEADKDGKPTDKVVSSLRVTAGGSAVKDTIFAGTEMEMLTVYTQDGPDLVMTHYCILGNQPRLKAAASSTPDKIVFKITGVGNLDQSNKEKKHMGETTIEFVDADHIKVSCKGCEDGKECETHTMTLVRKK